MDIFNPSENLIQNPEDLTTGDWGKCEHLNMKRIAWVGNADGTARQVKECVDCGLKFLIATSIDIECGRAIPAKSNCVPLGLLGKISGDEVSWGCPDCKDIIRFKEGNVCKCGHSQIVIWRGDLWVQFCHENTCSIPQINLEEEKR